MEPGTLFVVATPIGNLADITLRAIDTLRAVDRVVAEDTRRTRALLAHLGIGGKPIVRLDAHASESDVARLVDALRAGARIALVTDAGTPVVSDPGTALVRAASRAGVRIVAVPGASAVVAAVSVAGIVDGAFRFLGFLPRGGPERARALALVRDTPEAVVLFEAPQRMPDTLEDLARWMPSREAAILRELTKMHEEVLKGTVVEIAASTAGKEWLGEITLVLGPRTEDAAAEAITDAEIDRRIDEELDAGRAAKHIADALALETRRPRREMYERVVARKQARHS